MRWRVLFFVMIGGTFGLWGFSAITDHMISGQLNRHHCSRPESHHRSHVYVSICAHS